MIDPHTHEYMARLKDEPVFLALAQKLADQLQRIDDVKSLPKVRGLEGRFKQCALYDDYLPWPFIISLLHFRHCNF